MRKARSITAHQDIKQPHIRLFCWTTFVVMLVVSIICLFPPAWLLLSSMKNVEEFFAVPPTLFPHSFETEKIAQMWQDYIFMHIYGNMLVVSAGTLVSTIVFAVDCSTGYFIHDFSAVYYGRV